MRDYSIKVKPYQFLSYTSIEIDAQPNEHGTATVVGLIAEEDYHGYMATAMTDTVVAICAVDDAGQEEILFEGIVDELHIRVEAREYIMTLSVITSSALMDMVEHTRTFQTPSFTYSDILDFLDYYPGYDYIQILGRGEAIGDMIVQYKETDWAFLKRLASRFHTFITPDITSSDARYHFGMPARTGKAPFNPSAYVQKKGLSEYRHKQKNETPGISENDFIYFEVTDREVRRLFEPVTLLGRTYYIYRIQSSLHGEELLHTYTVKPKDAFKMIRYDNPKLTGASLEGTISDVTGDVVMVDLFIDEENSLPGNSRWLPYSTVYSSSDGTGWYAMPEIGDRIRLYYPTNQDKEGYVISAVHLETSSGLRANNDNKSIRTKYDKEVEFAPKTVRMTNNEGMTVTIDDEFGITIESDKEIVIKAKESLSMVSEEDNVYVIAQEQINLVRGGTSLVMGDNITVTGQEINVQSI
jgi:hypothetical protein